MKKIIFFILCSLTAHAQNKRSFYCTEFISVNRAYLNYQADVDVPKKFPTMELNIGVCLIKPLSEHFDLRSRIGYGVKFKRNDASASSQVSGKAEATRESIYWSVNEELAKQNTDFVDVPIILHYKTIWCNLGIELGFNYRTYGWFYDLPFVAFDYGPLCNITYTTKWFSVFCGATIGLNKIMDKPLYSFYSTDVSRWSAKSNSIQIGIEYDLFKNKNKKGKGIEKP